MMKKFTAREFDDIYTYKGYWHLPGGTVFLHEDMEIAAQRVAKEELGIDVAVHQLVGINQFLFDDKIKHTVSLVYLCTFEKGDIKLDFQASEYAYFKKIPKKIIPHHKQYI